MAELALRLARIALSVICSISPAPKTGVGIRKMMLLLRTCLSKSSCWILQPGASGCPVITKRAWTPPSRLPSGLNWNRASRIGPSRLMNEGMTLPVNLRPPASLDHAEQGVQRGARAPDGGLTVAARAAHEVEAGPDAVGHPLLLREVFQAHVEHLALVGGQAGNRATCSRLPTADAGVPGSERRRRLDLCLDHPRQGEERDDEDDGYG